MSGKSWRAVAGLLAAELKHHAACAIHGEPDPACRHCEYHAALRVYDTAVELEDGIGPDTAVSEPAGEAEAAEASSPFPGWFVVELLGRRRLAGWASEESHFGQPMLRLDVPRRGQRVTQFYGGASVYALTPTNEDTARQVAALSFRAPVAAWELSRELPAGDGGDEEDPY